MEMEKTLRQLVGDPMFLDTLYGWVYNHAYNRDEVDDIVHEIVIQLLVASQYHDSDYTYAYIWKIAENTHNSFQRKRYRNERQSYELSEFCVNVSMSLQEEPFEERLIGKIVDAKEYERIMREAAFLSRIHRDVMVLYYFNELSVSDIAKKLDIPENRVKQRLFSAREKIKNNLSGKGKKKMNNNNMVRPYRLGWTGSGNPMNSQLFSKLSSNLLNQNVLIACRDKAKTPSEVASELGVPAAYIENIMPTLEGEILKKCGDDKYIANMIVVGEKIVGLVEDLIEKAVEDYTAEVIDFAYSHKEEIMSYDKSGVIHPFEYYLWTIIPRYNPLSNLLAETVSKRYYPDGISSDKETRDYCAVGYYWTDGEKLTHRSGGYSHDGTWSDEDIKFADFNMGRFHNSINRFNCVNGIPMEFQMITKSIGGLSPDEVSEDEKTGFARAIELNYIKKNGDKYYPNVFILNENLEKMDNLFHQLNPIAEKYVDLFTDGYVKIINEYVPKHMYHHITVFVNMTASCLRWFIVEEAIKRGVLYQPEPNGTEGIYSFIWKAEN